MTEDELIDSCKAKLKVHDRVLLGSGDDCAVLGHSDKKSVISTDMLVENVHFRWDWSTPYEVGARAAMQNMADIAAMGAAQHSAVIALSVPPHLCQEQVVELSRGFAETYEPSGGAVVGGDLSGGKETTIAVTIIGDLQGREPLLRSGAQVGDDLVIVGNVGFSPAGYEILSREIVISRIPAELQQLAKRAVKLFKAPICPVEQGVAAGKSGFHAMMDVSDGLSRDVGKIASSSGVHIDFKADLLEPYFTQLRPLANYLGLKAEDWVFGGGEDHALVGTCPPGMVPAGFSVIGKVEEPRLGELPISLDGKPLHSSGWDHFS